MNECCLTKIIRFLNFLSPGWFILLRKSTKHGEQKYQSKCSPGGCEERQLGRSEETGKEEPKGGSDDKGQTLVVILLDFIQLGVICCCKMYFEWHILPAAFWVNRKRQYVVFEKYFRMQMCEIIFLCFMHFIPCLLSLSVNKFGFYYFIIFIILIPGNVFH